MRAALKWQAGVFLFTQNYEQDARETSRPVPVAVPPVPGRPDVAAGGARRRRRRPVRAGRVTLAERVDLTAGVRFDHEQKDATLNVFFTPAIRAAAADGGRRELLERVAAVRGRVPSAARQDGLRVGRRADSRQAASMRLRRLAPSCTARSTPGTSKAA